MVKNADVKIALIACISANRQLGSGGELIFDIKEDMAFFKSHTKPGVVIMGRKTFESLGKQPDGKLGKPLPGRINIVVTKNPEWQFDHDNVIICGTLAIALEQARAAAVAQCLQTVYIIGGEMLYRQGLYAADVIHLTEVKANAEGDAAFPWLDPLVWHEQSRTSSKQADLEYDFVTYAKGY